VTTGYTEAIEKGATFEQYVWRCARAFGALVHMRDQSLDAKVPQVLVPDTSYHEKRLREAECKLLELRGLTPAQAEAMAQAEYEHLRIAYYEDERQNGVMDAKYVAIRAQVVAWVPPSPDHEGLKKFMLEQIDMCSPGHQIDPPRKCDGMGWLAASIKSAKDAIVYYRKSIADEVERTRQRNEWLALLRASVPQPGLEVEKKDAE
jgi:hypothetical protein